MESPTYRRKLRQPKGGVQGRDGGIKSHYRLIGSASEQEAFNAGVDWKPATSMNKMANRSKLVREGGKKKNGSKAC